MSATDSPLDLASLQQAFANIELLDMRSPNGRIRFRDHLLVRNDQLKLKIYQENGHRRPHFHVDYGSKPHVATYAIDTGERLDGTLHQKYDKAVAAWAENNRESLLTVWFAIQKGQDIQPFVQALSSLM